MSKKSTTQLKGFSAVVVIMHHLANFGVPVHGFFFVGYLCVSVFFFISGYGLAVQYRQKGAAYINGFLIRRLPQIIIPYAIVTILYFITYALLGMKVTFASTMQSLVNGAPLAANSWYVIAIFIFYIIFYLAAVCFKTNLPLMTAGVFIGLCLYIWMCKALGYGVWWYNSCFPFLIGMIGAFGQEAIQRVCRRRWLLKTGIAAVIFAGVFSLNIVFSNLNITDITAKMAVFMVSSSVFVIVVFLLMQKIAFGNRVLSFLGIISFELYMIHGLVMLLLRNQNWRLESDVWYAVITLAGSVLLAAVLHGIDRLVLKAYKKLTVPQKMVRHESALTK